MRWDGKDEREAMVVGLFGFLGLLVWLAALGYVLHAVVSEAGAW